MSSSTVNSAVIDKAFEDNAPLRKRVYSAIASTPEYTSLFEDIAKYTSTLRSGLGGASSASSQLRVAAAGEGPAAKKRKLINGGVGTGAGASSTNDAALLAGLTADAELQFYVQDLSFAIPQRKKLRLELTRLLAPSAGAKEEYLRARNQASHEVEFGVPMSKIQHILCLPVPEKTQRQFNFCIIPEYGDGITTVPDDQIAFEPIVWTVPDGPPRTAFLGSGTPAMESANLAETYESYLKRMLDDNLRHTKVICPSEKEFVSPTPEAHRKGDKAYHVKAFRGSKEGFLFFLSTGIFFGFKKPLIFFSFENINSISYTSVLQRTFNLNIAACSPLRPDEVQEFELSMIDQSNHPGIDAYIKKHGLQDASLAEARRAKKLNINGMKGGDGVDGVDGHAGAGSAANDGGAGGEEEESELLKAQRELEDREDEEEEDYDPGSEGGDSDWSGCSSEEEDRDVGGRGGYDDDGGRDLVKEELGSEAEEIEEDE
ncbi:histone chaperone RTT106 [[Emmonsia] crescens]|uniref:Histone chaperone RTT106 n=1 Tax=[Emmonsia] crescens TaxID=73230 RepID=A0A0G2JAP7_9EURO|nr:histone chaperone RTT106 [Emmonsia crescens UAMH 3008]